ncbi:MAG: zinc metallopeptidase [Phycisphaerales bacterium]
MTTLALYWGFFDPLYFIILAPALLLGAWAQWRVKSAYAAASQMPASSRISGAEAAQMILDSHNIKGVGIELAHGGELSDHYDPKAKMLRLSEPVYHGHSVAALGIAAHEAGHAVQDHVHYGPLKLRNGIVPLASIGSGFSYFILIAGIILAAMQFVIGPALIWIGLGLFAVVVLFQLINLPVEYDASRRAKDLMQSSHLVAPGDEARAMNRVLNAAALTYVAATLSAILTLIYFVIRSGVLNDRR